MLNFKFTLHTACIMTIYALVAIKINCEIYTAFVDLEPLIGTEKKLSVILKSYLQTQKREKINQRDLKKLIKDFLKAKFINITDNEEFLSNPVNVFNLIKRLTVNWNILKSSLNTQVLTKIINKQRINKKELKFPSDEDFKGVALALGRLQKTYNLSLTRFADGEITSLIKSTRKLTAADCYQIANELHKTEDYNTLAILWVEEAMKRIEENKDISRKDLFEFLAEIHFKNGNRTKALYFMDKVIEIDPKNNKALKKLEYYKTFNNTIKLKNETEESEEDSVFSDTLEKYEKLCRNERLLDKEVEKQFKCYYRTNNSPFLLIQPIKVEDAYHYPWIAIFHELLTEMEIEVVKKLSIPLLNRAVVVSDDGSTENADFRISKSAWLGDDAHIVVKKLSQRIEAITGLDLKSSETLQVVNYGIGGYYAPHFDFSDLDAVSGFEHLGIGNRIATVLIYMSEVLEGGGTVFPTIGVSVRPQKGSAVFWYNLFKSGMGDYLTGHAGCPILAGNKWVSNKWIHEYHQEFQRPCGLKETDYQNKIFNK